MQVQIDGLTPQGEGVARIKGKVVFVPYALPGERIELEIEAYKSRYSRGKLQAVLDPDPERVVPLCPHFFQCGGCQIQHIAYDRQLEFKSQAWQETIRRIARLNIEKPNISGNKNPSHYRNKATWHLAVSADGRAAFGYYQPYSQTLIPINDCPLLTEEINRLSRQVQERLDRISWPQTNIKVVIRQSSWYKKTMLIFGGLEVGWSEIIYETYKDLANSLYLTTTEGRSICLHGDPYLHEQIGSVQYRLSPFSFWQINPEQHIHLSTAVQAFLTLQGEEHILDAYCGAGSIGLPLANQAGHITGLEAYTPAVADAQSNAAQNGLKNCTFINGPCETLLPQLKADFDAVILDPPRSGCHKKVIAALLQIRPPKILYISCNSATFARDLQSLNQGGYTVQRVQLLDMFPQTSHVETIALLTR